jgi:hypothetical protein
MSQTSRRSLLPMLAGTVLGGWLVRLASGGPAGAAVHVRPPGAAGQEKVVAPGRSEVRTHREEAFGCEYVVRTEYTYDEKGRLITMIERGHPVCYSQTTYYTDGRVPHTKQWIEWPEREEWKKA